MTGRGAVPPQGSRKVPGLKAWVTEDGIPYGPRGRLAVTGMKQHAHVSVMTDAGGHTSTTVAQLVARVWLPPKPEGTHLAHRDGDKSNNAASNLEWAPNEDPATWKRRWERKTLAEMSADPAHPKHGTRAGYQAGCRCALCTRAVRLYKREIETRKTIRRLEEVCGTTAR